MGAGTLKALTLPNVESTQHLARSLAACCRAGDCILLKGDLGAGKTTFARSLIQALCDDAAEVPSPTFTLVQTYDSRLGWPIWHFDLYRMEDPQEIEHIGLDEALRTGITLIEWPEIAKDFLPDDALTVTFSYGDVPEGRSVVLTGDASFWNTRLGTMA